MAMNTHDTSITKSSGNVFRDLGLDNPEELLAKAQLAAAINDIIEQRNLKQHETAKLLGITRPRVSRLRRGHLDEFSLDCLMGFLTLLDRDVKLVITKKPRNRPTGSIQVAI
jgi:predicted XRE-type DNA-binding protein